MIVCLPIEVPVIIVGWIPCSSKALKTPMCALKYKKWCNISHSPLAEPLPSAIPIFKPLWWESFAWWWEKCLALISLCIASKSFMLQNRESFIYLFPSKTSLIANTTLASKFYLKWPTLILRSCCSLHWALHLACFQ